MHNKFSHCYCFAVDLILLTGTGTGTDSLCTHEWIHQWDNNSVVLYLPQCNIYKKRTTNCHIPTVQFVVLYFWTGIDKPIMHQELIHQYTNIIVAIASQPLEQFLLLLIWYCWQEWNLHCMMCYIQPVCACIRRRSSKQVIIVIIGVVRQVPSSLQLTILVPFYYDTRPATLLIILKLPPSKCK